jgi:hypothetical protein
MSSPNDSNNGAQSSSKRSSTGAAVKPTVWHLLWRGRDLSLPEGTLVVGRAPSCHVFIQSVSISRTHASLHVLPTMIEVEDLNSANGVYVNGERVRGARTLTHGDRVLFGTEEMVLISERTSEVGDMPGGIPAEESVPQDEAPGITPSAAPGVWLIDPGPAEAEPQATTQKVDAFQQLGRLADRMLAMGRYAAATRILNEHMRGLLAAVRAGQQPLDSVFDRSCHYALKLAAAGRDGGWVDYVIELHLGPRRVLSSKTLGQLEGLLGSNIRVNLDLLRVYKDTMSRAASEGMPIDPTLLASIMALGAAATR